MRSIAVLALTALMTAGCAKKAAEAPAPPAKDVDAAVAQAAGTAAAPATSAAPAANVPAAPQPQLVTVSGTVLETIDASDYTYMRLKTESGEAWAAVTKTKIKKGDKVTVTNAMVMDGFESKTLKRTFDHIVFGVLAGPGGAAPAAAAGAGAASLPMVSDHPPTAGTTGGQSPSRWPPSTGRPPAVPRTRRT